MAYQLTCVINSTVLVNAYKDLTTSQDEIFKHNNGPIEIRNKYIAADTPKVVIALDEAHSLGTTIKQQGSSPALEICRTIAKYSQENINPSVWVVFASTNSRATDFSPAAEVRA